MLLQQLVEVTMATPELTFLHEHTDNGSGWLGKQQTNQNIEPYNPFKPHCRGATDATMVLAGSQGCEKIAYGEGSRGVIA